MHFQPVCNEEGNVVGLLDITKVFHEALDKVERSSSASEKLYSALAGVQSELGGGLASNPQAAAMLSYVEALREKTALPDLTTVMDSRTEPATVGPKTTVKEVAKLMKERRTTAVCVMETPGTAPGGVPPAPRIAGIFTSKDIVLRVIAAGLDAGRCSVVRVMTPHPDTAPPTMTVHEALKKMHSELVMIVLVPHHVTDHSVTRRPLSQFARGRERRATHSHRRCLETDIRDSRTGES